MVMAAVVAGAILVESRQPLTRLAACATIAGLLVSGVELAAWSLLVTLGAAMNLEVARERRRAKTSSQLPELADEIGVALSSRNDLALALVRGRRFVSSPDLEPFDRAVAALERGAPREPVLMAWAESQAGAEWSMVIAAVVLAVATASPRPLRDVALLLRVRRLRREDVVTQVAQAKASAVVVSCAPWVVLALTALVDPGYIVGLATSGVGRACVLAAATLTLVGASGMRGAIRRSGLS